MRVRCRRKKEEPDPLPFLKGKRSADCPKRPSDDDDEIIIDE